MQRFKQPGMDMRPDGEWIRYEDHIEAMKRIAGAPVAQQPQGEVVAQIGPADIEVVIDEDNLPIWCAAVPNACHDHIKDAIDRGIDDARHWVVRSFVRHPGYAAPAPAASPAALTFAGECSDMQVCEWLRFDYVRRAQAHVDAAESYAEINHAFLEKHHRKEADYYAACAREYNLRIEELSKGEKNV